MSAATDLSLLFDVFVVAQRTKQLLGEVMADSPLTPEEYAIYSAVDSYAPLSTSELARRLGMPVTTMHDQVREMLERRHATRHEDPRDRRAQLLKLSPAGRSTHREAGDAFDRAIGPLLDALRLPPDDVRDALEALGAACQTATERVQLGDLAA